MSQLRFFILTGLSALIALCLLLQIVFVRIVQADELQLKQTETMLQEGQTCFARLQQIASRAAQLAQQQQDQALRDLLTRQGVQIKANAPAAAAPITAPAAPAAPAAR